MPVVRAQRTGGWQADELGVLLDALDDWYYAEASVAERENAAELIWREFNNLFRPSSRDDAEQWRGLQWQEPQVGESEYDENIGVNEGDDNFDPDFAWGSRWLEATSTDGHTRVVFRFLDAEVRVRYAGPAQSDWSIIPHCNLPQPFRCGTFYDDSCLRRLRRLLFTTPVSPGLRTAL